ncbi:inter-alpha-trypsin inhibitor heavy chain H3-like [Penaeus japonicus]|uniref:inter-alpha-trypsin inhibitor heavy chain H3-like n=1 Tax=Penaeus japonicus TaxID=27405 RepID=UPI001C70D32E|nr:inter-alpha-trypsin inhibitor heavy chain H3-like [Penaeus japonicus]
MASSPCARPTPRLLSAFLLLFLLQVDSSVGVVTSFKVVSQIEHRYAITQVTAKMRNERSDMADMKFRMMLPKTAFISSFTIEVDGVNLTSTIGEPLPEPNYNHVDRRERSAMLVQEDNDEQKFEVSASVEGQGKVTFYLTYEELLRRVDGRYEHAIQVRPGHRIPEAEVVVHIHEREAISEYRILELPGQEVSMGYPGATVFEERRRAGEVWVKYIHRDPTDGSGRGVDGVFVFAYAIRTRQDGGEIQREHDHFVHSFCPERMVRMPTHTVFVLDVSISMKGRQFDYMKEAIEAMLGELRSEDTFELLVFSADVKSLGLFNGTRSHKKKVKRMMKRLEPMGNSYLNPAYHEALRRASSYDRKNVARKVVMVSDGWGTLGQTDPEVIRATLRSANTFNIPIFGVVFGPDADLRLIEQVSGDSGGRALKVHPHSGVKEQVRRFFQEISSPLLVDVAMSYPEGLLYDELLVRRENSNYFYSGGEMVTAGVLVPNTPDFHPLVTGRGRFGVVRLEVTRIDSRYQHIAMGGVSIVQRIWAYLKVQDLLAKMAASDDPSIIVRLHYTLQDLATRNRFVTEFTPLMVMLPRVGYELVYPQKAHKRHKQDYSHGQGTINKTFVVGDPNFIVHTPGIHLPFCFDYHGYDGAYLSLIQDPYTEILVNGEVTSASHNPERTYFSSLFFALGQINVTVTQDHIHIDCLGENRVPQVKFVKKSLYPFYDKKGRPYTPKGNKKKRKKHKKKPNLRKGVNLSKQCNHETSWDKGMARLYGTAMILKKQDSKQLDVILGDGEAHFAVTRSTNSDGQAYLGFYVEGQKILSPQAHGIIGQFNNKTIEIVPSEAARCGDVRNSAFIRVQRRNPKGDFETSHLCGERGSRHSVLSGREVECINVPDMGLGLLDRRRYDLRCLGCSASLT